VREEASRVGIIGAGLIGTSIGLRARALGAHVIGFDTAPAHLAAARAAGAFDQSAASFAAVARECELLVLAMPIEPTVRALEELHTLHASALKLVIDVASVKVRILEAAAGLPAFVGTHPIAGSERSGPQAARADLFAGHSWAYVPAGQELDQRAIAFIERMGAYPVAVQAAEHDRIVAATSHLPQMLSVALGDALAPRLGDELALALCGTGVRSMTRLGASAWSVWQGILASNGPNVAQEVRLLAAILASVADEIDRGDAQALARRFGEASSAEARLRENGSEIPRVS
jgi:prephenate dehydrogenase